MSVLLSICEGNPPVTGGSPHKGPETRKVSIWWRHNDICIQISLELVPNDPAKNKAALGQIMAYHLFRDRSLFNTIMA